MGQLAQDAPTRSGRTYSCKIASLIEDDEDRAAVDERMALTREQMSDRRIAMWLGVAEGTVTKHRFGACACARG